MYVPSNNHPLCGAGVVIFASKSKDEAWTHHRRTPVVPLFTAEGVFQDMEGFRLAFAGWQRQ